MDCDLIRRVFCSMALAILVLGLIASINAAVAAESSVAVPEVTVIAPRPPSAEELAGEAVPKFIASHATPSIVIHQIMRWRNGICPIAHGLSPAFNLYVSARIVAVAATVGAPHQAAERCNHNVEILFTSEPQQVLDELVKKRGSHVLGFHYAQQTKKLATFRGPIQGWYVTSTRGDRGEEVVDEAVTLPVRRPGDGELVPAVPAGRLGTRLFTGQISAIVSAIIVVDSSKVSGHAIGPISDYLAMMILSQAQSPDTCGTLPSIIDLMASNCGDRAEPAQLTAGDIAFLRALYRMDLRENLSLEMSDIQNAMMREFNRH
jgi:hypothetical protein